jgi:predicted outer membrane repeat protein
MAELPPEPPWGGGWEPADLIVWDPADWGLVFPETIEVPSDYATIQEAVDAADDGDTVLIAAGTYFENVTVADKAISIEGDGLVELWPDEDAAIIAVGTTPDDQWVKLEGLTFHSIHSVTLPEELGGGELEFWGSETRGVTAVLAAVQITNCTFSGMGIAFSEGDDEDGAAVAAGFAALRLEHCDFDDCRATGGGAVYAGLANLEMTYCTFENCQSDSEGGAVNLENVSGSITSCSFLSNSAYSEGGAIALDQASPDMSRCLFESNTAAWGGAVYSVGSESAAADPIVTECQFHSDAAGEYGDMWYASTNSDPWFEGCVGCGGMDLIYGFTVSRELNRMSDLCPMCIGDVNGDATIDVADLLDLLEHWGTADPIADLSGDGDVDGLDLLAVFVLFGDCPEL